jgi:hypothetical protein
MPRNPNKTRCQHPGCRAWAVRAPSADGRAPSSDGRNPSPDGRAPSSDGRNPSPDGRNPSPDGPTPPLCAAHRGRRGGAPPGNQNARTHGFYASTLNPDELADLAVIGQLAGDTTLDAEIVITRIALRRLLHMFQTGTTPGPDPQPLTPQDYANVIGLAFRGCGTLSRLLRARRDLGGEQLDAFQAFMDKALDLLSEELGRQL